MCPFCGAGTRDVRTDEGVRIECVDCGCTTPVKDTHELATWVWSQRDEVPDDSCSWDDDDEHYCGWCGTTLVCPHCEKE